MGPRGTALLLQKVQANNSQVDGMETMMRRSPEAWGGGARALFSHSYWSLSLRGSIQHSHRYLSRSKGSG